ncbi:hypothetical protein J7438_07570 [Thalassotalea sp. G20_0]|uniref:hypothetical protein n=1 Tax=Thalassotalea sp. G20_0 TaxID=2821093 RepID=UPI001ADD47AC|nr:hypothetical protein [Thalassotalea sp. G20_0]MBO9493944.1 hypothetical protein [Thalassotalea sp. G20_0]
MMKTLVGTLSVTIAIICSSSIVQVTANELAPDQTPYSEGITVTPVGSQSQELRQSLALPKYGQTMDTVREMLGNPSQTETIGEPAITRWYYPDRKLTVYFEGKRVLRSVVDITP